MTCVSKTLQTMGWKGVQEESDPWLYNSSLATRAEERRVC